MKKFFKFVIVVFILVMGIKCYQEHHAYDNFVAFPEPPAVTETVEQKEEPVVSNDPIETNAESVPQSEVKVEPDIKPESDLKTEIESPVCKFKKESDSITDEEVDTFFKAYLLVPKYIRQDFEKTGGEVYIVEAIDNIEVTGWETTENKSFTLGITDLENEPVKIEYNTRAIRKSESYHKNTLEKVVVHEMGHYLHARVSQLRGNDLDAVVTTEMIQAYELEKNNDYSAFSDTFQSSLRRDENEIEFYAIIFSGLVIDEKTTKEVYPIFSKIVEDDMQFLKSQQ